MDLSSAATGPNPRGECGADSRHVNQGRKKDNEPVRGQVPRGRERPVKRACREGDGRRLASGES